MLYICQVVSDNFQDETVWALINIPYFEGLSELAKFDMNQWSMPKSLKFSELQATLYIKLPWKKITKDESVEMLMFYYI